MMKWSIATNSNAIQGNSVKDALHEIDITFYPLKVDLFIKIPFSNKIDFNCFCLDKRRVMQW